MAKVIRYAIRFFAVLLLLWLAFASSVYIYFRTHKASLNTRVNTFLNERFLGTIQIHDIGLNVLSSFPYPALQVNGLTIDDSVYAQHGRHTVSLNRIVIVPGFQGLLQGNPVIRKVILEQGSIYLYRDSSGYYNGYVWSRPEGQKASSSRSAGPPRILRAEVHGVSLIIADSIRHKDYSFEIRHLFLRQVGTDSLPVWRTDLNVKVNSLAFNMHKGSFISGQVVQANGELGLSPSGSELSIKSLHLLIDRQDLWADGSFHFDSSKLFRLHLSSPSLNFASGRAWLTDKIARKMQPLSFSNPLGVDALISGRMIRGEEPQLKVHFNVQHNQFAGFVGSISDCSFRGYFTNQLKDSLPPSDQNSVIEADSLTGKYENSVAFVSKRIAILRLDTPVISLDVSVHNEVSSWNNMVGSEDFSLEGGRVDMDLFCTCPLVDSSGIQPTAEGSIHIRDADITYLPRQVKFTKGQVWVDLHKQDVLLRKVSGQIGKNTVEITGKASNFLNLAVTDTGNMVLNWNVYSPDLDIGSLLPFLGKGRASDKGQASAKGQVSASAQASVPAPHKSAGGAPDKQGASQSRQILGTGHLIDRFTKRCKVETHLVVDKLTYKRFDATRVDANLVLNNAFLSISHLHFQTSKGEATISGNIRYAEGATRDDPENRVTFHATLNDIDLKSLFYSFDEFGQHSLTSKNLSGSLTANTDLSLLLTDKGSVVPGSLNGDAQFSIVQGSLIDFQPLVKMGNNVLLKNRDFSHIDFSRLFDTFRFTGDTVLFQKMEIQSTVLAMLVEGVYKLDGTYTNAVIQVPLSNLKKPKELKGNAGVDTKRGPSIYIRAFNTGPESLHYKVSPFKKKVTEVE